MEELLKEVLWDEREAKEVSSLLNLVRCCLKFDPSERPSVNGMITSELFNEDSY